MLLLISTIILVLLLVGFIIYHFYKIKKVKGECPKQECPKHECPEQECPTHECPKQECPTHEWQCPKQECPSQVVSHCPSFVFKTTEKYPHVLGINIRSSNDRIGTLFKQIQSNIDMRQNEQCQAIYGLLTMNKRFIISQLTSLKNSLASAKMDCDDTYVIIRDNIYNTIPMKYEKLIDDILKLIREVLFNHICKDDIVDADQVIALIREVFDSLCPGTEHILQESP